MSRYFSAELYQLFNISDSSPPNRNRPPFRLRHKNIREDSRVRLPAPQTAGNHLGRMPGTISGLEKMTSAFCRGLFQKFFRLPDPSRVQITVRAGTLPTLLPVQFRFSVPENIKVFSHYSSLCLYLQKKRLLQSLKTPECNKNCLRLQALPHFATAIQCRILPIENQLN